MDCGQRWKRPIQKNSVRRRKPSASPDVKTTAPNAPTPGVTPDLAPVSLAKFCRYFLWLGTTGFGGPIALAGYMQRDLVERRRWVSPEDYLEGLALAQLAPGPLAAQLAIYLGYLRAGIAGASLVGLAFIGPSFLMVLAIAAAYVRYGGLPWMQPAFYGIGAAVVAIIARSAWKLARMVLRNEPVLWVIFVVLGVSTAITGRELVWLFLLGGLIAFLIKAKPRVTPSQAGALIPLLVAGTAVRGKALELLFFFTKAGAFVFGSGLAIVPFLYGGVVEQHHWLTDRQFLDAVAVAMITPGPVVITSGFIGYLVAGPWGALAAAAGVFVPVYLVVLFVSPFFGLIAKSPQARATIEGVTAAATGAIAGAVYVLGRRAIHDWTTGAIAVTAILITFYRKVPEPLLIAGAALAGVMLYR
jgi:chromate transporter